METKTQTAPPPPRPPKKTMVDTDGGGDKRLTYEQARAILKRLGIIS